MTFSPALHTCGPQCTRVQVRTITALALSSLAEAAHPYGIESFDRVLRPLWKGIRTHRGKGLAAFLKAIGFVIPLMDATYANYYTREVMVILIREFQVRPIDTLMRVWERESRLVRLGRRDDGQMRCEAVRERGAREGGGARE